MIGRFQPFSRGHLRLISAAKKEFESGKYDYIILMIIAGKETSKDLKRNPLTGQERKKYMSTVKELNGVKIIIAENVTNGLNALKKRDISIKAIIGGTATADNPDENTAESYAKLIKKYYDNSPAIIAIERDPKEKTDVGISATMLRHAALEGHWEEFRDNVAYEQEIAETVYYKIREVNGIKND